MAKVTIFRSKKQLEVIFSEETAGGLQYSCVHSVHKALFRVPCDEKMFSFSLVSDFIFGSVPYANYCVLIS